MVVMQEIPTSMPHVAKNNPEGVVLKARQTEGGKSQCASQFDVDGRRPAQ